MTRLTSSHVALIKILAAVTVDELIDLTSLEIRNAGRSNHLDTSRDRQVRPRKGQDHDAKRTPDLRQN